MNRTGQPGPCEVCSNVEFKRLFEKRGRVFWRCVACRLEMQHPVPSSTELQAYYDNHYSSGRLREMVEAEEMSALRAARRYREIQSRVPNGRWLDVGCADGVFVATARRYGVEAEGIDIAGPAVERAMSRGVPVTQTRIEDFRPERPFDVVTASDVIEHVPSPSDFLENVGRVLRNGGYLALTVPNLASFSKRAMRKRWYFYIPDGHLHYFWPSTLKALLDRHDFEVLDSRPVAKPVTLSYTVGQLRVLNPLLGSVLSQATKVLPRSLSEAPIPLYIGELAVVSRLRSRAG